jgi:hypothetical protein
VFGLGSGGLSIHIDIHPSPDGVGRKQIVPIDHIPSWKLNKHVFQNAYKKCLDKNPSLPQQQQQQQQQTPVMYPNNYGMPYDQHGQMMMPPTPPPPHPYMENVRGYGYSAPFYAYDGQHPDVQGIVNLILQPGKKYDHNGIKIQFLGRIEMVSKKESILCGCRITIIFIFAQFYVNRISSL